MAFLVGVAFLGVDFFVAAAFLGAAAFLAGAVGSAGALVLVTRPDFVFPRTRDTVSSTAGAGAVLRGLLALALGLAAATAAFLGAAVFFSAGFLVVAAFAFCVSVSKGRRLAVVDTYGGSSLLRCSGLLLSFWLGLLRGAGSSRLGLLLGQLHRPRCALGSCEVTFLLARSDGAVDVVPELSVAKVANLVVCLNVLLDSLTTTDMKISIL